MFDLTLRRRKSQSKPIRRWRGTELVVTYNGLDHDKDHAVRKALGKYDTGSGMCLTNGKRDHTATVPESDLPRVLGALKKIGGIRTKRLVMKWILCR